MKTLHSQAGATLLEGLIAIAIFSIGLLGLAGFQVTAMQQGQQARYRAIASFYTEQLLAQVQANEANVANFVGTSCTTSSASATMPTSISSYSDWCALLVNNSDPNQRLPITEASVVNASDIVTVTIKWKLPRDTETSTYSNKTNIAFMRTPT